jgi:small redox-active disulfide protein 2
MKTVKVLGSGCKKCTKTADLIRDVAQQLDIDIELIKETDASTIMAYGVMTTPAVVVDEKVVSSGSIPEANEIRRWLAS